MIIFLVTLNESMKIKRKNLELSGYDHGNRNSLRLRLAHSVAFKDFVEKIWMDTFYFLYINQRHLNFHKVFFTTALIEALSARIRSLNQRLLDILLNILIQLSFQG